MRERQISRHMQPVMPGPGACVWLGWGTIVIHGHDLRHRIGSGNSHFKEQIEHKKHTPL